MPTDFFGRVMVVFNRYGMSMLQGAGVSLKIALVGTLVGCIIGFAVGIVQTIPSERGDNPVKRAVLWAVKLILCNAFRNCQHCRNGTAQQCYKQASENKERYFC